MRACVCSHASCSRATLSCDSSYFLPSRYLLLRKQVINGEVGIILNDFVLYHGPWVVPKFIGDVPDFI